MGATLTGVRLFRARNYVALEISASRFRMANSLPVVRMSKQA